MKPLFFLFILTFLCITSQQSNASKHLILTGGPALRAWEDLRTPRDQHDRWWANFIRASTLRMDNIRKKHGAQANIVWLVHKKSYINRGKEDGKPYTQWIQQQATKRKAKLIWISDSNSVIKQMNRQRGISTFDFFGHSNKHCFLLDYSSDIMGACTDWLHKRDLTKLSPAIFTRNAICKSWGCHSGESMNAYWLAATGRKLIGARGKTDYSSLSKGKMPSINGEWVY